MPFKIDKLKQKVLAKRNQKGLCFEIPYWALPEHCGAFENYGGLQETLHNKDRSFRKSKT